MKLSVVKFIFSLFLLSLLQSCPEREVVDVDCNDPYHIVPDLATISPLKATYSQGDIITYKLIVESSNSYVNGENVNIREKSSAENGTFQPDLKNLLLGNEEVIVKGQKVGQSGYLVVFNSATNVYELDFNVKLNRKGLYEFPSSGTIEFKKDQYCVSFSYITFVKGETAEGKIKFEVL